MYRWQTMTLARIDRLSGGLTPRTMDAVRDFLYRIGQRHFPEPEVQVPPWGPDGPEPAVCLVWHVDRRTLQVLIGKDGVFSEQRTEDGEPTELGGFGPGDGHRVESIAYWVLFGFEPASPPEAPARRM